MPPIKNRQQLSTDTNQRRTRKGDCYLGLLSSGVTAHAFRDQHHMCVPSPSPLSHHITHMLIAATLSSLIARSMLPWHAKTKGPTICRQNTNASVHMQTVSHPLSYKLARIPQEERDTEAKIMSSLTGSEYAQRFLDATCIRVTRPVTFGGITILASNFTVFLTSASSKPTEASHFLVEPWKSSWQHGLLERWTDCSNSTLRPSSDLKDKEKLAGMKEALSLCGFTLETKKKHHAYQILADSVPECNQ